MMEARASSYVGQRADAVARPIPVAGHPTFDAYDCPAIILEGDAGLALETRSVLQSLGFDVLSGAGNVDADDVPVVIVMSDFLERADNRQKFESIRAIWPLAPVVSISHPADAAVQLCALFS